MVQQAGNGDSSSLHLIPVDEVQCPRLWNLCLARPKANAISTAVAKELHMVINTVEQKCRDGSNISALVISSSIEGMFCAGADLQERTTMTNEDTTAFLELLGSAINRLESLPIPTIAALDGCALGGGLELALACDFRIAARSVTKIGFPETRLGVIPGAGGTYRARNLLGSSTAKLLIYSGRQLDAESAAALGLVDKLADDRQSAFDAAIELAAEMEMSAPLAIKCAKATLSTTNMTARVALEYERECYRGLLDTKDRKEALIAFKERRAPVFQGK